MAEKSNEHHVTQVGFFGQRTVVHDSEHEEKGWVDDKGGVYRVGDSGGMFGNPEKIGQVDKEGNVHFKK